MSPSTKARGPSGAPRMVSSDPGSGHRPAAPGRGRGAGTASRNGQVAQRRADAAVRHRVAVGVDGDLGVELGAHRLPAVRAMSSCSRAPPALSSTQPSTSVRMDRYRNGPPCGPSLSGSRSSQGVGGRGRRVGPPQVDALVAADVGLRVVVGSRRNASRPACRAGPVRSRPRTRWPSARGRFGDRRGNVEPPRRTAPATVEYRLRHRHQQMGASAVRPLKYCSVTIPPSRRTRKPSV